ncbi:MAG: flavoprotein [Halobacteriovoraceae bacterium]|nr:flavoprotein [Halobacteriovoraceae bacterium]|tara:strand:+ start:11651 stop:12196 length:546 start_codon:yes stop_codon:yes gene_type:complete
MSKSKKILFSLTGSIACFKACGLLSELVKKGHVVQVVATHGAQQFIGLPTLEGLSGKKVLTDLYSAGDAMEHIDLHKWADFHVTCPMSAHKINEFAAGLGSDLLSTLFLSYNFEKPWFMVPAMNPHMYHHPITQNSIAKLNELGVQFIGPDSGQVACGYTGLGRMLEVEQILTYLKHKEVV